jgi:NAD(P) transhydrogenase
MESEMSNNDYDLIVIGSGPGGEGAAMQAAKNGVSVAVIEDHNRIGGGCTHYGTIPSKALRFAIFQLTEIAHNPFFRDAVRDRGISFPDLRQSAAGIIEQQEDMRQGFYLRNRVPILRGRAHFVDAHTLQVDAPDGGRQTLGAERFVIATGSRPYRPDDVDFDHPRIFDSDKILSLDHTPTSITIYGAGVIGCEYACMFRNLSIKVNLVNTRDKLLSFLDDEIIDALSYHLRDLGVVIRHQEEYERIEGQNDGVVLWLKSGKQLKSEILLWANGRTGNSDALNLEPLGIQPDSRGQLAVNEFFQTRLPHIYAVGDVVGFPALASAAYTQGRIAAGHICGRDIDCQSIGQIPTGIYTMPEISSVGKTERELTAAGIPYEVGNAQFKSLARAQITGRRVGMLKILFHRKTLELLGIHCFGTNASEIIHIGQAIMAQQPPANSLLYFMNTTFNYPTMAEAYRVAALNGFNRLF